MKKSFKIGALALAMSALLFSCADPNNNTNNSSKKAVNSMNDAQTVIEEISYDLGYSFGQTFSELASNQDFQTDIINKVLDSDGKPTLPINLDLANKQYNVTGLKLNIEKGKADITVTNNTDNNNTTYNATTDIVEEVIFDGSKLKVKDQIGHDENSNPIWSEPRDNKITSAVGAITLKATDVVVILDNNNSMPPAISGNISDITIKANAKFDTGTDGYAGNINLDGNVVASDLNELYKTITTKLNSNDSVASTIKELITYNNWLNTQNGHGDTSLVGKPAPAEPAYPTKDELTAVYTWIDTLNATINAKISFTDVNNANPFYLLKVTKLSELAKMYIPQKLSK